MKKKFIGLKKMMSGGPKATAELDASKDPMDYYRENAEPSITGLKGIAFSDGGKVPQVEESAYGLPEIEKAVKQLMSHQKVTAGMDSPIVGMGSMGLTTENQAPQMAARAILGQSEVNDPNNITHTTNVNLYGKNGQHLKDELYHGEPSFNQLQELLHKTSQNYGAQPEMQIYRRPIK